MEREVGRGGGAEEGEYRAEEAEEVGEGGGEGEREKEGTRKHIYE